jgi:lipopolysaccharide export system permease protein
MLDSAPVLILSRYYVARFLTAFALTLVASTLVIMVVDVLTHLDDVLRTERGLAGVAAYVLLRVPAQYLPDLIPVAAFVAAFFTLGTAARWLEITAIKSGGVSPHRVVAPLLVCACALTVAAFVVDETVVIEASRAWSRQLGGESETVSFRRGTFWYHRGDTIYNFTQADEATRTLSGVTLFQLADGGHLRRSIQAERARIEDGNRWRLIHAVIRDFDPRDPDAPPKTQRVDETVLPMGDERVMALETADAGQLTLPELREFIAARRRAGDDVRRGVTLLHTRLTHPIAVLLFVLLGAPLGLRVEQSRSMAEPALLGVGSLAVFFMMRGMADTLAGEGVLPAQVAPWLVVGVFAGWGGWRLLRVPR